MREIPVKTEESWNNFIKLELKNNRKYFTYNSLDTLNAEGGQERGHEDVGEEGGVLQLVGNVSWCEVHLCNILLQG